ncbi:hypothetical protein Ancab_015452 [Ancistrocladus abbreviatus]
MVAWGNKVFGGRKQEEQQVLAKEQTGGFSHRDTAHVQHCSCQCSEMKKEENVITSASNKEGKCTVCTDMKKKEKKEEAHAANAVNRDAKHSLSIEVKRKEKKQERATNVPTKDTKYNTSVELTEKEKKEEQATNKTTNACATTKKTEQREEFSNHCFRSMAGYWKERIATMRKNNDDKSSASSSTCSSYSSSSESDSEVETCEKKKMKRIPQGAKTTPK